MDDSTDVRHLQRQQLDAQIGPLQDQQVIGTYLSAIAANPSDFRDRIVLDLCGGLGVVAIAAARAGARHVYCVEPTPLAEYARRLVTAAGLGERLTVIQTSAAALTLPDKADVIIAEPFGVLLLHGRGLEELIVARDRWLAGDGVVYPARARLSIAPFSDPDAYAARTQPTRFWEHSSFFGVDMTPLAATARAEAIATPVVGPLPLQALMAEPASLEVDLASLTVDDLSPLAIDFDFEIVKGGEAHGLAGWFDAFFDGSEECFVLSTAPGQPATRWHQTRLLFPAPIPMTKGHGLAGELSFRPNPRHSYDVLLDAEAESPNGVIGSTVQYAYALQRCAYWWPPARPARPTRSDRPTRPEHVAESRNPKAPPTETET